MRKVDFFASVNLWNECNFQCSFCIGARVDLGKKKWEIENTKLQKLKQFFSESGKWEISLIGGEPLINPYLPQFCEDLLRDGHVLDGITTNASISLEKMFSSQAIKQFKEFAFSYHPTHENSPSLDRIFFENIKYVVGNDIPLTIIYVLLPERIAEVKNVVTRFEKMGAKVKLAPLYGSYNGKNYPVDYSKHEKEILYNFNKDIVTRQLLEDGSRISTLQDCVAGNSAFEIFLQSGKMVPCSHQQSFEIFNFLSEDAQHFADKRFAKPQRCLIKKCVCRYSQKQQEFLNKCDTNNMGNYEKWKELCTANEEVTKYWEDIEEKFVCELRQKIKGENVFIWGAGIHTSKLLQLLTKQGFPIHLIRGIIDSNPAKNGEFYDKIPVISAERFYNKRDDLYSEIIISSACYEDEIYSQIMARSSKGSINAVRLYDGTFSYAIPL